MNGVGGETVGGTSADAGNLISGNSVGIVISSLGTSSEGILGNAIQGNLIGTDGLGTNVPSGSSRQQYGIFLNAAPYNLIGGTTPGARNVISGNAQDGILILNQIESDATNLDLNNQILGNDIGLTALGTAMPLISGVPSQTVGIAINSSAGNVIGGSGFAPNTIQGNLIGVELVGTVGKQNSSASLGNKILQNTIDQNSYGIFINGSESNTISGANISANSIIGLSILGGSATGNLIEDNFINQNGSTISGATDITMPGDGIYIDGATGNTIKLNQINLNGFSRKGSLPNGVGVYIYNNASGNLIANNNIKSNTAYGILVFNSASNLGAIHLNGPLENKIGASGIAEFREFTGPLTTTATPKGPIVKKKPK